VTASQLKRARKELYMTQLQLAIRLGVSPSTVSAYEIGRLPVNPLFATAVNLLLQVNRGVKRRRIALRDLDAESRRRLEIYGDEDHTIPEELDERFQQQLENTAFEKRSDS